MAKEEREKKELKIDRKLHVLLHRLVAYVRQERGKERQTAPFDAKFTSQVIIFYLSLPEK